MYNKEWISYCKPPFKDDKSVIKYLGRYTHRVAISNNRIIKEENGEITFKYRDYKDNKKQKDMILKTEEFIRRFLMHILPPRSMKIRHYGLLGNRNKKTRLAICKNTDILDSSKTSFIIYNSGDYWNRIAIWFKNNSTIEFQYGKSSNSNVFNKLRITDIKGIKY